MRNIAFVGLGQAAHAFAGSLRDTLPLRNTSGDILIPGDQARSRSAAANALAFAAAPARRPPHPISGAA